MGKERMVHVWQLRCWNCQLLHKEWGKGTHCCPQNTFSDGELYPSFFGEKCGRFEPNERSKRE
jgi:hypothetical protein